MIRWKSNGFRRDPLREFPGHLTQGRPAKTAEVTMQETCALRFLKAGPAGEMLKEIAA